jgi:hypothetical protein
MQPDYQRFFPDEKGTKTLGREVVCKIASILKHNRYGGLSERLKELVSKTSVPQGI